MNVHSIFKGLLLIILSFALVFALAIIVLVSVVRNTTQEALQPMEQVRDAIATQSALLFNPTPTIIPDPVTIIYEIRSLARLETAQYSMEKIITAEAGQGELSFLFGDKLLFVAHGKVIAGVDLEKLKPEDLWVQNGVLYVRLPAAEIFVATLDNDLSYVYDRETGILRRGEINLETLARQAAVREIEKAAIADGILDWARLNAESYLGRLFRSLGYADVIFVK
ncbi:DUF4230 domain-containing protein [Bellilinea sp.]|jgi:hypothetical protein|uniref:DUF4230 domain-containing protein n=1 Tax=Bellilinea sp. TaxID=2838785 RepID=UPI002ADE091A|nr:DUF4230 domain-containing protein [Bellilinea sp.]